MPGSIDFEHVLRRRLAAGRRLLGPRSSGALEVEGETEQFSEVFVPAATEHRFAGDEHLRVLAGFAQPNKPD